MTVSSRVSSIIYVGDGQTTEFDVPFRFLEDSDLQLSIQATDGTVTNLVLNSDYTVTGANADNGGKVHLVHPVGNQAKLSILRVMDLLQETDYRENERFPAESHERALDKLTMETQQLQAQLDRAIKVDVFSDADPSEIVYEIEELYDIKDSVITAANISSDIVTCSHNIDAIKDAPNQATSAATSAQTAASYASSAHIDAGMAENSAQLAQQWATKMDGAVDGTDYSAKHYAQQSNSSATAAQEALDNVNGLIATPIGTIFMSIYVDESLDIARRLNGQLISSTKFTGFRAWLNDVQTAFPSLFTTETNWQAEKTNSKLGQCGKFVVDDTAGTIRLPAVVNAQGLTDLQYLGTIKNESLPNITGKVNIPVYNPWVEVVEGAFSKDEIQHQMDNGNDDNFETLVLKFNASNSSSTYQNNAPVQQEAVQYPYYIQVATGVDETLPAIREYKVNNSDYFGKSMYSDVDPNNASWLVSKGQWNAKSVYPDYYNWLLTQVNKGAEDFITTNFRQYNEGESYAVWTNDAPPVVGMIVYAAYHVSQSGGFSGRFPITAVSGNSITFMDTVANIERTCTYSKTVPGSVWDSAFVVNQNDQTFRLPLLDGSEDLPSDRYEDLTLQASGSSYTAPANGWFFASAASTSAGSWFYMSSGGLGETSHSPSGYNHELYINVKKGASVLVAYGDIGTVNAFHFIPAVGNGSLYYYVGDTVQDASLINAGAVLGQLANKADIDASNFSTNGKSLLSGLGMPSNRYIDLTLGASGSTYTAPANGYVYLEMVGTQAQQSGYINSNSNFHGTYYGGYTPANGRYGHSIIYPATKGEVFTVVYSYTESGLFRFIYAEGENNV